MSNKIYTYLPITLILLCAVIGGGLIAYASRGGIGVESDTASYFSAARNLVAGEGFGIYYPSGRFVFFSYWAPLYALLLASLSYLPLSTFAIVRWLNVFLFAGMVAGVGIYFYHLSRHSILSILLSILIACSPLFTRVYLYAMSESLFFVFVLAGIFSAFLYFDNNQSSWFYRSAIFSALAVLTRYAAIPLVLTILLGLLVLPRLPFKVRIIKALKFGFISLSGLIVWFCIVWSNTATVGGRRLVFTEDTRRLFNEIKAWFIDRLTNWLAGHNQFAWMVDPHYYKPFWIGLMLAFLLISVIVYMAIRHQYGADWLRKPGMQELLLCLSFIAFYAIFLIFSYVFSAPFGLGDRIFSPFELFSLISLFIFAFIITRMFTSCYHAAFVMLLLTMLAGSTIIKGVAAIQTYPANGIGYNTIEARASALLQKVNELPDEMKLITNEAPYLLFHANKFPFLIQELTQETPDWDFKVYGSDPGDPAQAEFIQGTAALVLFPSIINDFSMLYGNQASLRVEKLTIGLHLYYSGSDGQIYFSQPTGVH
ncbi:MAG: hypothetical protein JXR32_10650 [Anaerolineaceae bacterium]|nr:hypothetical protein [Anaerolineaceae bacterium]